MEAVIISGLQGAGKSTFCRERYWNTHIRLNLDMLRTRHRERLLLMALIEAKQPFVVDNTNPTAEERNRYILPAKAAGFRIVGIQFEVPLELALLRNTTRPAREMLPEKAVRGTFKKLVPLSYAESFDQILRVRSLDHLNFEISEILP